MWERLLGRSNNRLGHAAKPGGALANFVGVRLRAEELVGDETGLTESEAALVDAWPLPALEGASFNVSSGEDIAPALRTLLTERLPGHDWWVEDDWAGPFRKYGILHGSIPAPPNAATGERMSIELYGQADSSSMSQENISLFAARMQEWSEAGAMPPMPGRVALPTRVVIGVATYSNVSYPGRGVGFYL